MAAMAPLRVAAENGMVSRVVQPLLRRRGGQSLCLVVLGTSLCTLNACIGGFVVPFRAGAASSRESLTQRHAGKSFSDGDAVPEKKARPREPTSNINITPEKLQRDHGDKWEMVDDILKGKKAASPEAIMRARFTALRFKDPNFLAATEKDEFLTVQKRTDQWATLLGLKESGFFDKILNMGSKIEALKDADTFELIYADEDEVEFKIGCVGGKVLHERSSFSPDRKWGFVYSGNSKFGEWSS